ncbi:MAG: VOC family protein [Oscillospiraceae bacterium]
MRFKNPLLAVTDLERSVAFYREVLGLRKVLDFGANVTLTGGVCLQTADSWAAFIGGAPGELGWCGRTGELYFEEEDFDAFAERLRGLEIHYVHPVQEQAWGQRAVRFYDPDCHIIEVGESMTAVCRRFLDGGMTPEQAAARMDVPLKFVRACMREENVRKWKGRKQL